MEGRPETVNLVFKDDTGVKHESNKFNKGDLAIWNVDMSVPLRSNHSQRLINIVQVC